MALAGLQRPSSVRNNFTQELFQILPSACLQRLRKKRHTPCTGNKQNQVQEEESEGHAFKNNQAIGGQATSCLNGRTSLA